VENHSSDKILKYFNNILSFIFFYNATWDMAATGESDRIALQLQLQRPRPLLLRGDMLPFVGAYALFFSALFFSATMQVCVVC
jgi:hypothetical protein